MAELMSEAQKISAVYSLVQARQITNREAQIYCLKHFGTASEPPMDWTDITIRCKCSRRDVSQALQRLIPIVDAHFCELIRRMGPAVDFALNHTKQTPGLYFGITKAFGSDTETVDDEVQKVVLMGYEAA